jgi:hypothetical protein
MRIAAQGIEEMCDGFCQRPVAPLASACPARSAGAAGGQSLWPVFHKLTGAAVLLGAAFLTPALHAEQGILSFVFGPSSPEAARASAHASAAAARKWVQGSDGIVELRRAGSDDVQQIDSKMDAKQIEQLFSTAVMAARDADPPSFLIALDAAAQGAASGTGAHIVVAVLNTPSFSSDGEKALDNLQQICHSRSVSVLVLDVWDDEKHIPALALHDLVTKTGGFWVRQAKELEAQVAMVTPPDENAAAPAPTAPPAPASKSAAKASNGAFTIPFSIPVYIRLMRIAGSGSTSESIGDHDAAFGQTFTLTNTSMGQTGAGATTISGGGGSNEVSYWPNDPHAPLQGLVTVETPLTALRFEKDDATGTYQGHARITALVRDAHDAVVWTGRKDVTIHGPLGKLEERRQGSMFFMRGVTIVGLGPFTLEAKVEDLVGNTTGSARTPLRVGRNAPGLVASDALVVRSFKGAADKFEADQVFSYEGDALSPVLDPVFAAAKPVNLEIYLRLYPDIQGGPIDLSMEVFRDGRVVTRMALPFKTALSSSAREGPTSATGGSNIVGGQAHEFPYLANLKAKFPPGDYEAIISIHQGKNVIRRPVAFKVMGDGSAPAPAPARTATGPQSSPTDDADSAPIVLPDIEPAKIDSSGLKMREADQKQLWDAAAKNAMGYLAQLPNFRCVRETHRFTAPARNPNQLNEADSYQDDLIYEDGKESYQRLESNGEKVDVAPVENKGVSSRNEFGSMLHGLFDPDVAAAYHWAGRSMALGVLCQVFEFEVSRAKSNFVLRAGSNTEAASYTGRVFIDEDTGLVRRLTIEGGGLSKDFGLQSPSLSLDYGMVKVGEKDYLLPLRSVLQLRQNKTFVRNETVFRGYRRWEAESHIKFGK